MTYGGTIKLTWPRGPLIVVTIHNTRPEAPVQLPLQFISESGVNNWELVRHIIQLIVNEKGQLQQANGTPVVLEDAPTAIECIFVPTGQFSPPNPIPLALTLCTGDYRIVRVYMDERSRVVYAWESCERR